MKSSKVTPALLDFWVKHNKNVIFIGRRGVGKTAIVRDCFERNGLKWKYFSAATMDPWCDFIGIPRAVSKDGKEVLEYVMSPDFADDTVEALFFDEFNRSHKKVRDAVMELIQFKSINGRKFNNLRVVWAAINPKEEDSEKYDVEELDPAILDRFHVHVSIEYSPSRPYFESRYGAEGASAVSWWVEQPKIIQNQISPRRLEYALQIVQEGGNAVHVFPVCIDTASFVRAIRSGSIAEIAIKLMAENKVKEAKDWLKSATNVDALLHIMTKRNNLISFYLPILSNERITKLLSSSSKILSWVMKNEATNQEFSKILDSIVSSNQNKKLIKRIIMTRPLAPANAAAKIKSIYDVMQGDSNTVVRAKSLEQLHTLVKGFTKPIPKEVKNNVIGAIKAFMIRSQSTTIRFGNYYFSDSRLSIKALVKKIHKIVPLDSEAVKLCKEKGIVIK